MTFNKLFRSTTKHVYSRQRIYYYYTWLKDRNIDYPESATKDILWSLINDVPKTNKSFVVDSLIHSAGHEVLRLPPYHCQYNAIEMVWSQAKRIYDKGVLTSGNVVDTWKRAVDNVTATQWANYVKHTDGIIKADWERDKIISPNMQPFVITLSEGSDDEDTC